MFILFIIFLILVSNDKKEVFHSYDSPYNPYYRGDGYYTQEVKGGWVFLSVVTGIGSFVALIIAITYSTATIFVKELDGYHVLVYGHSNDFRLILENRVVDRYSGGRYDSHRAVRLSGKLPNNKIVFASIYYKNYERVIKVELAEDANKSIVNGNK